MTAVTNGCDGRHNDFPGITRNAGQPDDFY